MNDRPRRRLLRSRDDRIIAGVAGGIARRLDVDPTLVRLGFAIAALFGGLGIIVYVVLALVTPNDDGTGAPVEGEGPSPWLIGLAIVAGLILLPGPFLFPLGWGGGWWWDWGGIVWMLLLVAGAIWLYMTIRDRRRDRGAGPPTDGAREAPAGPGDSTATTAVMPEGGESDPGASARGDGWSRALRALVIAALAIAAVFAAATIAGLSAWATAVGEGTVVAGAVIAIGVVLIAASFARGARWLIIPALVVAVPAGAVAAADIRFDDSVGEREYRPSTARTIPDDGYRLGVGRLVVDLRALPWQRGDVVEVRTDLGIGQTVVSVPPQVCVEADTNLSVGEAYVRGERSSGVDPELVETPPAGKSPRLMLEGEQDAGQLVVTDDPPDEVDGHDRWRDRWADDEDDAAERLAARRACES
jgi:phage shock protein PspC (stress-responsive transcriptional regulator)